MNGNLHVRWRDGWLPDRIPGSVGVGGVLLELPSSFSPWEEGVVVVEVLS